MFNFLKEKIGNWVKKLSKKKQEVEVEPSESVVKQKIKEEVQKAEKQKVKKEKEKTKVSEVSEPKEKSFFQKIKDKITKVKISEQEFNEYSEELEMLLIENNVALEVAEKIIKDLKERVVGKELLRKEIEGEIRDSLRDIIEEILIEPFSLVNNIKEKKQKPYVILFCGVNGTGKTTTIAKLAYSLKQRGLTSILAAADTFRAASIEQIKEHGEKLGIKVISHEYGSDPAAVAFDAIEYAKKHKIDAVLIDTAGRMHTAKNLMAQIEKIAKVSNADAKIFVGESITGNDSIEQVRSFDAAVKIDGIILSKADVDEKGGTALSVGYVTKKPILYLGTGQEYDKLEPFNKRKFIEKLGLEA